MGIADTEQQILDELKELSEEKPTDTKASEELLKEAQEDLAPEESEDANEEDNDNDDDKEENEEEENDDEKEEEESEEEEEPTGAKFRHKLKEEKARTEQKERENLVLHERLARLEGKAEATPIQEVAEEIPDIELEPEQHALYQNKKLEKRVQEMEAAQVRSNAERQWETMQAEHAKIKPEYNDAKAFLLESEAKKIKAAYPSATDAQISQHLKEQEYITAGNAARAGILPTDHIEYLAYQAGYRAGEEVQPDPKQKPNINKIKKNAKKNASLIGGSSAGETGDGKSAEQLAAMGLDEIIKWGPEKFEKAIRKIEARTG